MNFIHLVRNLISRRMNFKNMFMVKMKNKPPNAPSTTGKPSGGGRGNNPPKPTGK